MDEKKKLTSIMENTTLPFEGYYPTIALCCISRWMYEEKKNEKAIEYAEKAKIADEELGEPDFLLGWYTLFVRQGDPIEYFQEAIRKESKYLGRITHDPALGGFPDVVNSLKQIRAV